MEDIEVQLDKMIRLYPQPKKEERIGMVDPNLKVWFTRNRREILKFIAKIYHGRLDPDLTHQEYLLQEKNKNLLEQIDTLNKEKESLNKLNHQLFRQTSHLEFRLELIQEYHNYPFPVETEADLKKAAEDLQKAKEILQLKETQIKKNQ